MSPKYKSQFARLNVPHHERIPMRLRQVITEAYVKKRVSEADLVNLGQTIDRIHDALGSNAEKTDAHLKPLFEQLKTEDDADRAYRVLNEGLHAQLSRLFPDLVVRYVKGPLRGTFADHAFALNMGRGVMIGHGADAHINLPTFRNVNSDHAFLGRQEIDGKPAYYLQPREGRVQYRHEDEWTYSTLEPSTQKSVVLENGLEFKIGPHTFQVVDPAIEKLSFWERPISRRRFLAGAAVGAGAAAVAATAAATSEPFVNAVGWLNKFFERRDKNKSDLFGRQVSLGAYPYASWINRSNVSRFTNKGLVHFVPLEGVETLSKQAGVRFGSNAVFVRLNQESQDRWRTTHAAKNFFSQQELEKLSEMTRRGVTPHFVIEPTEGLYSVPRYAETLKAIAADVAKLGPAQVQFAPGLNSPKSPYYWKKTPRVKPADQIEVVRKAFQAVHLAFALHSSNTSLLFSPLLPHEPKKLQAQADEIARLAATVKPYVKGAGGLFFPDSVESVAGLPAYADVLKKAGMPFLGLDGFAARTDKAFDAAIEGFKRSEISGSWKYLNFHDVNETLVSDGGKFAPWSLTSEKLRRMRQRFAK